MSKTDWKYLKIREFAEVTTGGTPSTVKFEYWQDGKIPWLNSGELNQENITTCDNYITEAGLKNSNAKMMPPKTILVALTGATTGKTGFLTFDACANQSVTGILPSKKHEPKFLYYYLSSIRKKILDDSYGGAQKHISQSYIKDIEIPLPPLPIQQKVAAILDKADALRRKDKELLAKYDELLQAVFYDMFGDPVKNEKGWEVNCLNNICNSFKYGTNQKSFDTQINGAIPIIRIPNVLDNKVNYNDLKYSSIDIKELKQIKLEKGDLLFVRTNGNPAYIGRCAVYNDDKIAGYASYLIRAKVDTSKILPEFVQTVLSYSTYRSIVLKKTTTTAGNYNINTESLKSLIIPIPPIELQKEYVLLQNNIDCQKSQIITQQTQSENLFQSLIQRAFKGELVG